MDTNINSESMNKNELRSLVRKAINEVLNEDKADDNKAQAARKAAAQAQLTALNKKKAELSANKPSTQNSQIYNLQKQATDKKITQVQNNIKNLSKPGTIDPVELDEMANVAVTYELVPNVNPEDYSGKKRRIIDTMLEAGEPMSKPAVAAALGYDKQNPINADFMALVAQGAVTPTAEQAAPRFTRPVEPEPEEGEDIEFNDEEPGQEEFEDEMEDEIEGEEEEDDYRRPNTEFDIPEMEPEIGELEPVVSATGGMSDEDYQAWMQYDELKQRLNATKSNINKAKRSRRGGDDLSDFSMDDEIKRLIKLKDSLQDRIKSLVSTSSYLQDKIAKENEPTPPSPSIEDVIDDEEQQLDEWTINKWKYYAGIKK